MRFFRKKDDPPRWVDADALNWSPEEPLDAEPRFTPGNDVGWTEDWRPEPRAATPQALPQPQTPVTPAPLLLAAAQPEPEYAAEQEPTPPPAPANSNAAPSLLLTRLGIGLAQGLWLFVLVQSQAIGAWPGSDPYLFAALSLAGLFAPLVLLEGLGDIEEKLLALWAGTIAATLATLGLYQHWRIQGQEPLHASFALAVLCAVLLFVAQVLLRASLRAGTWRVPYRILSDTTWTLAGRLLVWTFATGLAWALIGSGNSLLNWLRQSYPTVSLGNMPTLVILPLVGLASAAALHLTAPGSWLARAMKSALLTCCTLALPMLAAGALIAIVAHILVAPLSLALALTFALALVIAFNASYRDGTERAIWRRGFEGLAAVLIVTLVTLAAIALHARVSAYGWTGTRVFAAAAILTLGAYGIAYAGAVLISIGGGRWMQRVEIPNRILALGLIAATLILASPLADPVKLAVAAQAQRMKNIDPAMIDFDWLRRGGLRFGDEALLVMTHGPSAQIARDAAIALSTAPGAPRPTPTEIGANIAVRTSGAKLPATLLTGDWDAARVPPCLTKPALSCDAWFLDMNHDGQNEILLVYGNDARWWASVMKQDGEGNWSAAATLTSPPCRGSLVALRSGDFATADPLPGWRDLLVGGMRLVPQPAQDATQPCRN